MRKGSHLTEEAKHKISESLRGRQRSEEHCKHISEANKGRYFTEEHKHKLSEAQRGKLRTEETKRKMCEASRRRWQDPEYRRKQSEAGKGWHHTEETRKKVSEAHKLLWQDPAHAHKILAHKKTTQAEHKLNAILQELFPNEFALNVRAEIMVLGGKVPDFVNMNGKKKLIELYSDYWHDSKQFPGRQSPQERIDYFKQFGNWDTLIVWEHELKNEAVLKQKLQTFVREI